MTLCLVSAFLDIGRQNWSAFRRSIQQYLHHFLPYTKIPHKMIVFMDDRYVEVMTGLCRGTSIRIIPINRDWMQEHIFAYSLLGREREIMASETFQAKVKHRLHHPECSQPEYNIMQHAKIDFVMHVIQQQLSDATYYAWTDFGFFQDPSRISDRGLDVNKFVLNQINFQGIYPLNDLDFNIAYTLIHAPERVGGFFYLGRPDVLAEYQQLYHEVCEEFHRIGIVDDDQHIMIQCVHRNPDLFHVHTLGAWHLTYLHFQNTSTSIPIPPSDTPTPDSESSPPASPTPIES